MTRKRNASMVADNANNLVRIVEEGHMLADHTYDHMKHNNGDAGPRDAYKDIENDLRYGLKFGGCSLSRFGVLIFLCESFVR